MPPPPRRAGACAAAARRGGREHLGGERGGESQPDQLAHEAAAAQPAAARPRRTRSRRAASSMGGAPGAPSPSRAQHVSGHRDGLDHALGIGDALPGAVEGGAVVHRHAQEREADGDVHAGQPRPRARRLIEREAERLHGDMALVVVHRDHDVELAAARAREQRVGGQGTVHVEALAPRRLDGRRDLALLLVAEEPVLAGVRIEPAHRDACGRATPEEASWSAARARSPGPRDRACTRSGTRRSATCVVTWMTRSSLPIRSMAKSRGVGQLGQDLRMPGVLMPGGGQRLLVDGGGDHGVDLVPLAEAHRRLDVVIGGPARLGAHRAARQARHVHVLEIEALQGVRGEAALRGRLRTRWSGSGRVEQLERGRQHVARADDDGAAGGRPPPAGRAPSR